MLFCLIMLIQTTIHWSVANVLLPDSTDDNVPLTKTPTKCSDDDTENTSSKNDPKGKDCQYPNIYKVITIDIDLLFV